MTEIYLNCEKEDPKQIISLICIHRQPPFPHFSPTNLEELTSETRHSNPNNWEAEAGSKI